MQCRRLGLLSLSLLMLTAVGCPKGTVSTNNAKKGGGASAEELLKSAISQLQPDTFAISAASDKPVALLNSWREGATAEAASEEQIPSGWLDDAGTARLKGNFDARDAVHIRDSMLAHTIANYVSERATDEVSQARAIFDYVVRNIALPGADATDTPLDIYEILLLGRGTAEDRAWACAAILRQRRIDCVIVRPAEEGADPEAWLLGVILNRQIYLFDPKLGLPIPSSAELVSPTATPATLVELGSHPEWLQHLSARADQPYPITAEMLKQPAILPIVGADFWSPRMRQVESVLPAADVCVLYDPLSDETERTGLVSRLKQAIPDWNPEKSKPWAYPRQRISALQELNRQRRSNKDRQIAALEAWEIIDPSLNLPFPVLEDESRQPIGLGAPERRMLRIRTDQLLGKFEDATKRYLAIRHLEVEPTPVQQLAILNRMGAENAIFWTGICKFEAREYESAVEQLTTYLNRFDRSGRWNFAARSLLAECHLQLGHPEEAAAVLQRSRSDDPNRVGNAIRLKRLTAK